MYLQATADTFSCFTQNGSLQRNLFGKLLYQAQLYDFTYSQQWVWNMHLNSSVTFYTLLRSFSLVKKRQWRVKQGVIQQTEGLYSKALRICDDVGVFRIFK